MSIMLGIVTNALMLLSLSLEYMITHAFNILSGLSDFSRRFLPTQPMVAE